MKKTFETEYPEIKKVVESNLYKWKLKAVPFIDQDDISQELYIHIDKKWHLYNQKKPLPNWLQTVIKNFLYNKYRDYYYKLARPCVAARCSARLDGDGCKIYGKQCSDCPIFAEWEKNKKSAHDIYLPLTIENHFSEVNSMPDEKIDLEKMSEDFIKKLLPLLTTNEKGVFNLFFIEGKTEVQTAKILGLKVLNRECRQVKNIKNNILTKAKEILYE